MPPKDYLKEAALMTGVSYDYAYRIAAGLHPWQSARPSLVRHLYDWKPWSPKGGRHAVKHWLNGIADQLRVTP